MPTPGRTFAHGLPTHALTIMLTRGMTTDMDSIQVCTSVTPGSMDRGSAVDSVEAVEDSVAKKSERRMLTEDAASGLYVMHADSKRSPHLACMRASSLRVPTRQEILLPV